MSSFGGPGKYAGSRRQEIEFQKELQTLRNKALVEHYTTKHEEFNPSKTEAVSRETALPVAQAPRPPAKPKPGGEGTARSHTVKKRASSVHLQIQATPLYTDSTASSVNKTEHKKPPHEPKTATAISGATVPKQPSTSKITLDSLQSKKFAIAGPLNTTMPVRYTSRPAPTVKNASVVSKMVGKAKPRHTTSDGEPKIQRPLSQPDTVYSTASSQKMIISGAEYLQRDSNVSQSSVYSQTPTPSLDDRVKHHDEDEEEERNLSAGSVSLAESESEHSSVYSSVDVNSDSEYEDSPPSRQGSHDGLLDEATSGNEEGRGVYDPSDDGIEEREEPQSGMLKLEIDMRFSDTNLQSSHELLDQAPSPDRDSVNSSPHGGVADLHSPRQSLDGTQSEAKFSGVSSGYSRPSSTASDGRESRKKSADSIGELASASTQLLHRRDEKEHSAIAQSIVPSRLHVVSGFDEAFSLPNVSLMDHFMSSNTGQSAPTVLPTNGDYEGNDSQGDDQSARLSIHSQSTIVHSTSSSTLKAASTTISDQFDTTFSCSFSSLGVPFSMPSDTTGCSFMTSNSQKLSTPSYISEGPSSVREFSFPEEDDEEEIASRTLSECLSDGAASQSPSEANGSRHFTPLSGLPHSAVKPVLSIASSSHLRTADSQQNMDSRGSGEKTSTLSVGFVPWTSPHELEQLLDGGDRTASDAMLQQGNTTNVDSIEHSGTLSAIEQAPSAAALTPDIGKAGDFPGNAMTDTERVKSEEAVASTQDGTKERSGVEGTMQQLLTGRHGDIPQNNLAEFLAYSDRDITLEDVMSVQGKAVAARQQHSPAVPLPDHTSSLRKVTEEQAGKKVTFLSTWTNDGHNKHSGHASIHHFCSESLGAQLSVPMLVKSRLSHTTASYTEEGYTEPAAEKGNKLTENLTLSFKKPHTHQSVSLWPPKANKPVKGDNVALKSKGKVTFDVAVITSDSSKSSAALKSRLGYLKDASLGNAHAAIEREGLAVSGGQMEIARDPSSLLWSPAPPKLGLYPSTVKAHLVPHYHTTGGSAGREEEEEEEEEEGGYPSVVIADGGRRRKGRRREGGERGSEAEQHTLGDLQVESFNKPRVLELKFRSVPQFSTIQNQLVKRPEDQSSELPAFSTQSKTAQEKSTDIQSGTLHHSLLTTPQLQSKFSSIVEQDETDHNGSQSSLVSDSKPAATPPTTQLAPPTSQGDSRQRHPSVTHRDTEHAVKPSELRSTKSLSTLPPISKSRPHQNATESYNSVMKEVKLQRSLLVAHIKQQLAREKETSSSEDNIESGFLETEAQSPEESPLSTSRTGGGGGGAFSSRRLQRQALRARKGGSTTGSRAKAICRTKSALARAQMARELISKPPRKLKRSGSFPVLVGGVDGLVVDLPPLPNQQLGYRRSRRLSEPAVKDFPALMAALGASAGVDGWKWACSLWWDTWFPEVLKECREAVAEIYSGRVLAPKLHVQPSTITVKPQSEWQAPHTADPASAEAKAPEPEIIIQLDNLPPPLPHTTVQLGTATMQPPAAKPAPTGGTSTEFEIEHLSREIASADSGGSCDPSMLAVLLCRRGALSKTVGRLKDSKTDLDRAVSLQPSLSDCYWHRHLLYLLLEEHKAALDDLTSLLKLNKKHFAAYRSKAALLAKKGDLSSAVYNLSQAIALQRDDAETYFIRAELYEKRGEVESALSDYCRVCELDPTNTEAISRQAHHKFNKKMWAASTQHFTALLQRDPNNTSARIHRARAQYNLGRYVEALQDLSASIHLSPSGSHAWYHRGCLLRQAQPQQALRDFSISLLLDDSQANVHCCIHRGILYTQMKCYDEALADFEAAIRLDRTLPSPHVCAGLIHMLHRGNLRRAALCFTATISVEPTCLRALLCRAEASKRGGKLLEAIQDYTRAIHIEPNNPTYYLYKGEIFLRLKRFEMAALHIRIAAKLSTGFDQSKTQKALVESFLGNHEDAISLLKDLTKSLNVFSLMGKIQYKAAQYDQAAESFRRALELARIRKPSEIHAKVRGRQASTTTSQADISKPEIHFLCGRSLVEGGALAEAVEEFSRVLQQQPDHATAYYERGVAKLKAGSARGVQDLNRALALDSTLFQAYLARASHYGRTGRHSKAILNCNEAIKLMPTSVRAHLVRGALKYHTKLYSGAIADLSTAIALDRRHSHLAHFNRALCYQATGQLNKALSDYSVVLLLQDECEVKVLINRGLLYLQFKDYSNALLDFTQAGKSVRNDPLIFQAIGVCYHQLGALESAIAAYSQALRCDQSFVEAYVGRGNVHMEFLTPEGNQLSRSDYKHALELEPDHLPARVNQALLLQAEGHFRQAWEELSTALQQDKSYVPALEARAIISLQMNNVFGALLDISAAIEVSPSAELYTNRGVVEQFAGDVPSAMRDYQRALKSDPDYALAHFNIGNVLFQQRHFKQAIASYSRSLAQELDDSVLVNRAITHSILHNTQAALEDFTQAIEVNPYSAHAFFNKANLHRSMGDIEKAAKDYKQALELQPDDWLTMYYYGETLGLLNRPLSAQQLFRKAAETEVPC